jgi:hypothetical protein
MSGSANGMRRIVPAVSSAMSAAARPRSPRAFSTTFGKNGAPAAPPSSSSPAACPRSIGMTTVITHANAGASTKFSASASSTKRPSRSGAPIAHGVSVSPIAPMLLTRKTSTAMLSMRCSSSFMQREGDCLLPLLRGEPRGAVFADDGDGFLDRVHAVREI